VTEVTRLDGDARIVELAEMLGGAAESAASQSARELLDHAEAWRLRAAASV